MCVCNQSKDEILKLLLSRIFSESCYCQYQNTPLQHFFIHSRCDHMICNSKSNEIFGLCPRGRNNFILLTLVTLSSPTGLNDGSGYTHGRRKSCDQNRTEVSPFARSLPTSHTEVLQIRTWMQWQLYVKAWAVSACSSWLMPVWFVLCLYMRQIHPQHFLDIKVLHVFSSQFENIKLLNSYYINGFRRG